MFACLLQSHGETIRGKGNAVFCPCFSYPTWWCLLCIRYGHIKLIRWFVRTCALRRNPNSTFLTEHLLVSSRLHKIVSVLFEKLYLFERFWNHGAGGFRIFYPSAIVLLVLTVSKPISQVNVVYHCGKGDQMALPSVDFLNPLPCAS